MYLCIPQSHTAQISRTCEVAKGMSRPKAKWDPASILLMLDEEERRDLAHRLMLPPELSDLRNKVASIPTTILMSQVIQIRLPFMEMMRDIADFLQSAEVKARGSARFVLLEDARDLKIEFGEQMQAAIARCFDKAELLKATDEIDRRIEQVVNGVQSILRRLHPKEIRRDTALSQSYSRSADPWDKHLAQRFKRTEYDYNPADSKTLDEIKGELESVLQICRKLSDAGQLSGTLEHLQKLTSLTRDAETKVKHVRSQCSHRWPPAAVQIKSEEKTWIVHHVQSLKELLFAVSEFSTELGTLADFFNLDLWQHRWRIYELWTLVHLVMQLSHAGFQVDLSTRVRDGVWSLKFTKDSSPVATLLSPIGKLDLYYQLYRKTREHGDMPDIALVDAGGGYVLVADPKHGLSYSRHKLAKVATRYHESFSPSLTVIHNYYPMEYTCECVQPYSNCLLISSVQPSGKGRAQLDQALRQHLDLPWKQEPSIVVLFDISSSTTSATTRLAAAFNERIASLENAPSGESVLVFFADGIVEKHLLSQVKINGFPTTKAHGGTSITSAMEFGIEALGRLTPPRCLWIFSDGEPSVDVAVVARRLKEEKIDLEVFECGCTSANDLRRMAEQVKGRLHEIRL
jgi:hypothetical protein